MSDITNRASVLLILTGIPILLTLWMFSRRRPDQTAKMSPNGLNAALAEALPGRVLFAGDARFAASIKSYWSARQRDIVPACILRPENVQEVSTAIRIIKEGYDHCVRRQIPVPTFAIRSGGHSVMPGHANASDGINFDLSHFKQIEPASDGKSVLLGCAAKWGEVARRLAKVGLAVAGGRNSDVGVGGLTLGGGYSFFSPQTGFVCDNVIEFHVVLASGESTVASPDQNADLWRALKGGGNNFGIVTHFKFLTFASTNVWAGFLYMFSWKAPQAIRAFSDHLTTFDEHAAGPILCFGYVQQIGLKLVATHLVYTKPTPWPACWQRFKSIGRIWSTAKVRPLASATDELDSTSPPTNRYLHISTVVKNDLETLQFAHAVWEKNASNLRLVKGMVWTLVLQPVHIATMAKGLHNVLGLSERQENLVVVLFTVAWARDTDDVLVDTTGKAAIDEIDRFAKERKSDDGYRYMNWAPRHPNVFEGYGKENDDFLKGVSSRVDPDGLFQKGCIGGFKLSSSGTERS